MKFFRTKFFRWSLVFAVVLAAVFVFSYWRVSAFAKPYLYDTAEQVPYCKAALVLGTSAKVSNGQDNLFFKKRIAATVQLYEAGKMQYIIVSGDNSRVGYNEPEDMKMALMAAGIPDSVIVSDYAGFRTFDSVVRCNEVFGQQSFIIISQPFHNARAIYIARQKGLQAFGFNAENVTMRYSIKTSIREIFARVKVMLDIHVLPASPKFGGPKVKLR